MDLLAIAGGTPGISEEPLLLCCGIFLIWPLALFLSVVAVASNSVRTAAFSLSLAALPFLLLLCMVAGYKPSDDWEVMDEQDTGRRALAYSAWPMAVTGPAWLWLAGRRLVRRGRKHAEP